MMVKRETQEMRSEKEPKRFFENIAFLHGKSSQNKEDEIFKKTIFLFLTNELHNSLYRFLYVNLI